MADMQALTISIVGQQTVTPAANAAASALGALEGAAGRVGSGLANMAATAVKATAAVAAIGAGAATAGMVGAVKVAASFEQQMSAVVAVMSRTELAANGGIKALSDLALQLGKETSFSAREAAAGLEELAKAGVSVRDIFGGAGRATLDLAAAGGVEVAEAATIASNALNVFNKSGAEMGHVADVIAGAANASAIDVHDFGLSLQQAGAVANLAGVSFEDLSTAIALMGNAGIRGSDAGTSLKVMLTNLNPTTKAQISAFKELGIITGDGANQFFDATGKAKSLAEMAGILQNATRGMTQQQKLATLEVMFGTDALRAAAILTDAGAEGFRDLAAAIGEVGAQDVANTRLDNLAGSLEKLKGSVETVAISVGLKFTPALKRMVDALTDLVNRAEPAITKFAERAAAGLDALITRAQRFGPRFLAFGAGLLAFGRSAATVAQSQIPRLVEGFERIVGFFRGGGASGLAGGASSLVGGLIGAFRQIEPVVVSVGRAVVGNLTETFRFLTTRVLPPVVSIVEQTGAALERTLLPAFLRTGQVMRGIFGDTLDWLARTVWPPFLSIVEQTANFWTGTILPTLPAVGQALRTALGETVQWLATDVWPKLTAAATVAWGFIAGTIVPAIPGLARSLRDLLGGALEWVGTTGWPALVKGADTAWKFLQDKVIPVVRDVYDWLKTKLPEAINTVTSAFEAIKGKVGPIVEQALAGDIAGAIKNLGSAFAEFATLAVGWLGEQVARIDWANVWNQTSDVLAAAASWFADAATRFAGWIGEQVAAIDWGSVWGRAVNVVQGMAQWFVSVVTDFATWIGERVAAIDWAAVWAQAKDVVAGMAQWFADAATQIAAWIGEQVAKIDWPGVWSNVTGLAEAMQAAFEAEAAKLDWKAITTANKDAAHQMAEGINEMIRSVDWTAVGQEFAANMFKSGGGLETAMRAGWKLLRAPLVIVEPLVEFIKTADWGAVAQAFADVVAGFIEEGFRRAWAAIQPNLPSWLDPVPRPPPGAMPFPYTPGATPSGSPGSPGSTGSPDVMRWTGAGPIDNSSRESFVRTAYPYMLEAAGGDKNLAEMMLAAAISENGDVGSGGAFIGNNFFGIKGTGTAGSFNAATWEQINGQRVNLRDDFAAYNTPVEGFQAFMQFLRDNPRYGPSLQRYQQTGDAEALFRDINRAGYATDPAWGSKIANIRANQVSPVVANLPSLGEAVQMGVRPDGAFDFTRSQQQWAQWANDANAICGPYLAALFTDAVGRPPSPAEARALAEKMGIYSSAGTGSGILNASQFDEYATALIRQANPGSTANVQQTAATGAYAGRLAQESLASGMPLVGFNTPGHYFGADQFNPETGQFHVGGTGLSLAGGSEWMSIADIERFGGAITSVITLAGEIPPAMTAAAQATDTLVGSTSAVSGPMGEAGTAITATGEAVATLPETMTAAAEGTTAAAETVTASFDVMREGSLTSVTDLGAGVLTTVQDMAGNTVATVTDMAGNVTSQSATLANGVSLNMADMGVKSTQSVDQMAGTITTVMTDAAGNAVTTVTNMQGQVVAQYAAMQAQAGSAVAQLAQTTEEQIGTIVGAVEEVPPAVERMGDSWKNLPRPDVGGIVREFERIADAAEDAMSAVDKLADKTGVKSGSGKSNPLGKRHSGGPVAAGVPYLVGKDGAEELFIPRDSGYVVPGTVAPVGGGGVTVNGPISITIQGSDKDAAQLAEEIRSELIKTARRNGGSDALFG